MRHSEEEEEEKDKKKNERPEKFGCHPPCIGEPEGKEKHTHTHTTHGNKSECIHSASMCLAGNKLN